MAADRIKGFDCHAQVFVTDGAGLSPQGSPAETHTSRSI